MNISSEAPAPRQIERPSVQPPPREEPERAAKREVEVAPEPPRRAPKADPEDQRGRAVDVYA